MSRVKSAVAVAFAIGVFLAATTEAQTVATLRVTRRAVIMESPRSDAFVLGTADPGATLAVLGRQGAWYQVTAPAGMARPRGWIQVDSVELLSAMPVTTRPRGRRMIRGFGQASGTLFTANDSFETILKTGSGRMIGGGGQVVFPSGAFVLGSVERFRKTGSRVLVSGTQLYTLQIPDVVTVTPIQLTAGYRGQKSGPVVPYAGVGLGWQTFREDSPSLAGAGISTGHIGYHILAGAELPIWSWFAVAGELGWSAVPKGFGGTGLSAVVNEDDLGGTTFRFKLILGI